MKYLKTDHGVTIVFNLNGSTSVHTISDSHPNWNRIIVAIQRDDEHDAFRLVNLPQAVEEFTHNNVEVKNGKVFYKGIELFGLDVTRLLEYIRDNIPYTRLLRFIELKMMNPSFRSIQELYKFLEHREMTLDEDGYVIGYKGVREDYYSVMGNLSTIVTSGTVDKEGHILNKVGEKVRCDRSCVCDDFTQGCSPGLHIGSLEYAKSWGSRVMVVRFNPADAVSVPSDSECQKLRACAYEVIAEYSGEIVKETPNEPEKEYDDQGIDYSEVFPNENDIFPNNSTYFNDGMNAGIADGRAHKARKHFVTDIDKKGLGLPEIDYIRGYNEGYKQRYEK